MHSNLQKVNCLVLLCYCWSTKNVQNILYISWMWNSKCFKCSESSFKFWKNASILYTYLPTWFPWETNIFCWVLVFSAAGRITVSPAPGIDDTPFALVMVFLLILGQTMLLCLDAKVLALKDTMRLAWKCFLLAAEHWQMTEPWGHRQLVCPTKCATARRGSTGPQGWGWSGECDGN